MEDITAHIYIAQVFYFIIHVVILIASIIIISKKKSTATVLLLIGGILSILNYIIRIALNAVASFSNQFSIMDMQVIINYTNVFIFSIFGIGLLLFAINDLKRTIND